MDSSPTAQNDKVGQAKKARHKKRAKGTKATPKSKATPRRQSYFDYIKVSQAGEPKAHRLFKSRAHTASCRLFIKEKASKRQRHKSRAHKAKPAKKSQTKRAKNEIYTQKKDKL